jgi:UDPglucose 6-dehydrogenase
LKITVIGTGYVGLVSGVCYAEMGHQVICVDKDQCKITKLQEGHIPIHEPGLKEMSMTNMDAGRLSFSTYTGASVKEAEVVIIAVGTPPLANGEADMQYIESAAREIALELTDYKVIVIKSTVPVGTNEKVKQIIQSITKVAFDIASVPEFLREGSAVKDTLYPDRIVIGVDSEMAGDILVDLYSPITKEIVVTDIRSSEMIKYASNAFLATKISFINEIANICERVGADVTEVAKGMGLDRRIGPAFLSAGIGYGGSCFPKDTQALVQIAGNLDYDFKLLKSVIEVNKDQRLNVIRKLEELLGSMRGCKIGIWGLAFKPNTDDIREAPALDIIADLLDKGAIIQAYDPIATENFKKHINSPNIVWCENAMSAARGVDAVCLLTEWPEFSRLDMKQVAYQMKQRILIDGRNVYQNYQLEETDFQYYSVGRPQMNQVADPRVPLASGQ